MRIAVGALALVSLLLGSSPAGADVAPPARRMLVVGDVHVVAYGTEAPREEQARAVREARASMEGFLPRIDRCLRDHGGLRDGRARARLEYDRATLPARARVVEGTGGLRACVAEVLPSIALANEPHGRIQLEITVVAIAGWR